MITVQCGTSKTHLNEYDGMKNSLQNVCFFFLHVTKRFYSNTNIQLGGLNLFFFFFKKMLTAFGISDFQ